jgi:hypothetical protein
MRLKQRLQVLKGREASLEALQQASMGQESGVTSWLESSGLLSGSLAGGTASG